jgi:hypothetical protein
VESQAQKKAMVEQGNCKILKLPVRMNNHCPNGSKTLQQSAYQSMHDYTSDLFVARNRHQPHSQDASQLASNRWSAKLFLPAWHVFTFISECRTLTTSKYLWVEEPLVALLHDMGTLTLPVLIVL